MNRIYESLLDVIGNTPLVKVKDPSCQEVSSKLYAKLEYLNPGGSIKDRSALFMIENAEKTGLLKPGGTIIEASSGNQGISSAMIARIKGYKCIITIPEKTSAEKAGTIRAYGAQVIVCKATENPDDPENYHKVAQRIQSETPNSFMINQYFNTVNADCHYYWTGPEIYAQTLGKITHFIAACGSCGTISGIAKYLKQQNPNIKIIGVDSRSEECGIKKPTKLEGIGMEFNSPVLQKQFLDTIEIITDDQAKEQVKYLAKLGFLVGPSSGAVCHVAYQYAKNSPKDSLIVCIFGDSGRAYLSKNFY